MHDIPTRCAYSATSRTKRARSPPAPDREDGENGLGATVRAMTTLGEDLVLLVDHDNVAPEGRDPRHLVVTALGQISSLPQTVAATLRAYGGWFEEYAASPARYEASAFYQNNCPVVLETNGAFVRIHFEFADSLAASSNADQLPITHTVGLRRTAGRISPRQSAASCALDGCELRLVRKWFRRKAACTAVSCPLTFGDVFERREQKQVDVHLTADLMFYAARLASPTAIAVVSDDLDIVPAILTAAVSNPGRVLIHLRSPSRSRMYNDDLLRRFGVRVVSTGEVNRE